MTIQFECANCGKQLSTSDDKAGKTGKCPDCGEPVTVPQPELDYEEDDPFNFDFPAATSPRAASRGPAQTCPMCGSEAPATADHCPNCGEALRQTERRTRSSDGRFSTGNKIDVGLIISTAWQRFTAQPGGAIGGLIITALAMFGIVVLGFLGFMIFGSVMWRVSLGLTVLAGIVAYLALYAAAIWLMLGMTRFFIALARGHAADFSLLFSGGKFILRAILCGLLMGLLVLLAYIGLIAVTAAAGMVAGRAGALIVGLLAILLIIRVIMSFLWWVYVLVDIDARDVSSVFLSRDLMVGNYLSVFLILIVIGLLSLIPSAFTFVSAVFDPRLVFVVGMPLAVLMNLFIIVPLTTMIMAVTYDHLSGGQHRRPGDVY